MYGREKMWGEPDWRRRLGYALLGELHIPGRLRTWHVIRELKRRGRWGPGPLAVLDAGGGEGAFAYHAARRFPTWRVVVADNDRQTLERARRIKSRLGLHNLDVRRVDLREPGDEHAYDVVVCADVLEHIDDDHRAVKHLSCALKPGGLLIVTAPSVPQPRHLGLVAWRERRIHFSPEAYGHVRQGYSRSGLQRLFHDAGLEVEAIHYTFGRCGTLMFDLFFTAGDSRPHPAVYGLLFPVYMVLAALDMRLPARHGAAVLGIARKPASVLPVYEVQALSLGRESARPTDGNPLHVADAGPAWSA
jgi:2-polyprenyl-3-methyl-5-hydroxy-6-metoxy-1,4-benzoquinol methylase